MNPKLRKILKKTWHFIWEDDSVLSWLVNIVLAFILIKFIVYPGLGFLLSTSHPVVAVVSESMEHKTVPMCVEKKDKDIARTFLNCRKYQYVICGKSYNQKQSVDFQFFWKECGQWYENSGINSEGFKEFKFKNGFNKGDIMVLKGNKPGDIEIGDIVVFRSRKSEPIIHRVVKKQEDNNKYFFHTKGDHNKESIKNNLIDETNIPEDMIIGRAFIRIPYLGYIKIWFNQLICLKPIKNMISIAYPLSC